MKFQGFLDRIAPLGRKLAGQLPLCPWSSVLGALHPATLGGHPPRFAIEEVERDGGMKRLRFGEKHFFWFPEVTPLTAELWSEYLSVFWRHRANGHYYLEPDTPVAPGDVCIDCGACEGFFTQQALEMGAARVVCVEPSAQMARCLERTFVEAVEEGRATIVNAAAGAVDGACSFSFDEADPFSGRMSAATNQSKVRMTTIDSLGAELGLERLDYIKMDIEGAELQALEGALGTLRRDAPKLAITTYHRPFDYAALRAVLTDFDYRIRAAGITRRQDAVHRPVMLHASS